jgi:3-deoxy-7-phosphoheptulonate synthase
MGNADCHVILRGGSRGPNYDAVSVAAANDALEAAGLSRRLMIDCSHANSGKKHTVQPEVVHDVAGQVGGGSREIFGVMLESFLEDGRQDHSQESGTEGLEYGKSITDACMSWERTVPVLAELADAVRKRRDTN